MQNNGSSNKILRDYVMKDDKKSEIFHSSGYAEAQSGEKIGTASSGLSMAKRKALEEKRQFVQKYNNSGMLSESFSNRKMTKRFNPEVNKTGSNSFNNSVGIRNDVSGDAAGNTRISFGRSDGNSPEVKKLGGTDGYTPFKTGNTGSVSSRSAGMMGPSFKPKF